MADASQDASQTGKSKLDVLAHENTLGQGMSVTFDQLLLLDDVIRDVLENARAQNLWPVIQRRFGFFGSKKMTLEEIARALVVSKQRVEQIEKTARKTLSKALLRQTPRSADVPGSDKACAAAEALQAFLLSRQPTVREDKLHDDIAVEFNAHDGIDKLRPTLEVFLTILDFTNLSFRRIKLSNELSALWTTLPKKERDQLSRRIAVIHRYVTQDGSLRQDMLAFLSEINKRFPQKEGISRQDAPDLLALCSSVEMIDGMVQAKFEYLKGRENQVERLLSERMEPMSCRELARKINHRLVPLGYKKVAERNLSNQISQDDRFDHIGGSGEWGLRTWDHVAFESIVTLMERYLITRNSPATVDEIYDYVRGYRSVELNSIIMNLGNINAPTSKPVFKPMGVDTWGLASWASTPEHKTWNDAEVAELVANLLRQRRVKELGYGDVRQALMLASGLTERQAQGKLNRNGRLAVRRESRWGSRFISLKSPDQIGQSPVRSYTRHTATARERVAQLVRERLAEAPGNALPLDKLVAWLQTQVSCAKPTLYSYIAGLDSVEKVPLAGSRGKLCHLVIANAELFPEVSDITTEALRHEVERAVRNLTVEQVDIGLFMLGRAFERTLKACLIAGIKSGRVSIPQLQGDPAKWKLVTMVEAAKSAQIIQDASALQSLRAERNNRAHGDIPSLQEREALMAGIKMFAGPYIKYIKLLDDQERSWV